MEANLQKVTVMQPVMLLNGFFSSQLLEAGSVTVNDSYGLTDRTSCLTLSSEVSSEAERDEDLAEPQI